MEQKKIRRSLFIGSALTVVLTMFFLWILNSSDSPQLQRMLGLCILILGGSAVISLYFFFRKGPVFHIRGQIETGNIMAMLIAVLVIIQLAFAFAAYFQKEQYLRFVLYDQHLEEAVIRTELADTAVELLTTLVISIFFSVEVVWLMIKLTTEKKQTDRIQPTALSYVRQLAFVFYFASRLSAAFIPIMAKSFGETIFGMSANGAAALPQSAETLLTCAAIFLTTEILTRRGWKLPFGIGLLLVAAGTFLSAVAPSLLVFIAARAVVGLGYGFCWMTLRNLALFGKNDREQTWGFSMLNAGLYAGMNCGSSLGAILAEKFGYQNVFYMAAALTLLCSCVIIKMENATLPEKSSAEKQPQAEKSAPWAGFSVREKLQVVSFAVLMIAPSCIAASYTGYFLPIYFESIGRGVSDVGRAQLLYGVMIVYVGPKLSKFMTRREKGLLGANYAYNLLFSAGFLLAGIFGGLPAAMLGVLCLAVGDSFGFSVQNNYFLALPSVKRMGASRSLSYLSFLKKLTEMLGPTLFAMAIVLGYERGVLLLGGIFAAAVVLFWGLQLADRKWEIRESRKI